MPITLCHCVLAHLNTHGMKSELSSSSSSSSGSSLRLVMNLCMPLTSHSSAEKGTMKVAGHRLPMRLEEQPLYTPRHTKYLDSDPSFTISLMRGTKDIALPVFPLLSPNLLTYLEVLEILHSPEFIIFLAGVANPQIELQPLIQDEYSWRVQRVHVERDLPHDIFFLQSTWSRVMKSLQILLWFWSHPLFISTLLNTAQKYRQTMSEEKLNCLFMLVQLGYLEWDLSNGKASAWQGSITMGVPSLFPFCLPFRDGSGEDEECTLRVSHVWIPCQLCTPQTRQEGNFRRAYTSYCTHIHSYSPSFHHHIPSLPQLSPLCRFLSPFPLSLSQLSPPFFPHPPPSPPLVLSLLPQVVSLLSSKTRSPKNVTLTWELSMVFLSHTQLWWIPHNNYICTGPSFYSTFWFVVHARIYIGDSFLAQNVCCRYCCSNMNLV